MILMLLLHALLMTTAVVVYYYCLHHCWWDEGGGVPGMELLVVMPFVDAIYFLKMLRGNSGGKKKLAEFYVFLLY